MQLRVAENRGREEHTPPEQTESTLSAHQLGLRKRLAGTRTVQAIQPGSMRGQFSEHEGLLMIAIPNSTFVRSSQGAGCHGRGACLYSSGGHAGGAGDLGFSMETQVAARFRATFKGPVYHVFNEPLS